MTKRWLQAFSLLLLLSGLHSNLMAADLPLPNQPHIVVNGSGSVEHIPDIVKLQFEVSATAENFSVAKKIVDKAVSRAIKAAKKQRIKDRDINASRINASPQYDWQQQSRVYKGERVSRQVEITLKDADRYNQLVDGLLAAGINQLHPVQLEFSQRNKFEAEAMTLALDDARHKAETIAQHMGSKLQGVFQIAPVEQQFIDGHMVMSARAERDNKDAELTLKKQKLEQQIRVVYLLSNQ